MIGAEAQPRRKSTKWLAAVLLALVPLVSILSLVFIDSVASSTFSFVWRKGWRWAVNAVLRLNHGFVASRPNQQFNWLQYAIVQGDSATAIEILSEFPDDHDLLRRTDGFRRSPLTLAAMFGEANVVDALIKKGINVNDPNCENPLTSCVFGGGHNIVLSDNDDWLPTANPDWKSVLGGKQSERTQIAKSLIRAGLEIDGKSETSDTALENACAFGMRDMFDYLLTAGADINYRHPSGWTILMTAVVSGRAAMVEVVLGHVSDVNLENSEGQTALDIALEGRELGNVKDGRIEALLLKHGAKRGSGSR